MSTEQNKLRIHEWYAAIDRADLEGMMRIMSPNIIVHFPGQGRPIDRAAYKEINAKFFAAFSDFDTRVLDQIAEGDKVATRAMHSAIHRGEFEGFPGTGKKITYTYIAIDRFEDGVVVEHWVEYDEVGLLEQLGGKTD